VSLLKTTIIIPCYNCEKTIQKTLDALDKQTINPTEIICVDDGSKDNTKKIIQSNKKVKYIYETNSGPAKARNTGAKQATGEIILFMDSDCVPQKNWLEEMLNPLKDEKIVGVQGAYKTEQEQIIAKFVQEEIEERYKRMRTDKKLDWIGSYSAAFRKKDFMYAKGYDESFPIASGEDPEFSFRLIEKTNKELIFNDKAIVYHTHPTTLKKYLKVKFFRAAYRPKMYKGHEEKIIKDSYTPQKLKIEIVLFYMTVGLLVLGLLNNIFWQLILFTILTHLLLEIGFIISIKNKKVAFYAIAITFLRTIVFGTGLIYGILPKINKI